MRELSSMPRSPGFWAATRNRPRSSRIPATALRTVIYGIYAGERHLCEFAQTLAAAAGSGNVACTRFHGHRV
jgi:hypothetical protein